MFNEYQERIKNELKPEIILSILQNSTIQFVIIKLSQKMSNIELIHCVKSNKETNARDATWFTQYISSSNNVLHRKEFAIIHFLLKAILLNKKMAVAHFIRIFKNPTAGFSSKLLRILEKQISIFGQWKQFYDLITSSVVNFLDDVIDKTHLNLHNMGFMK